MASPAPSNLSADAQPTKVQEQITFRFCRECSNMLYPKEDRMTNKLMFACRTCQFSEEAISSCVFRNNMYNTVGETAGVTQDVGSDPTVGDPDDLNCSTAIEQGVPQLPRAGSGVLSVATAVGGDGHATLVLHGVPLPMGLLYKSNPHKCNGVLNSCIPAGARNCATLTLLTDFSTSSDIGSKGAMSGGRLNDAKMVRESRIAKSA
ncbi:MAG: hypothetical protein ASARMPRED_008014 [Alectoria sarmentosa]|nr:MAG: hypothetical protein ASARMPRED_008014 [Alectoria sarmentosa]